MTESVRMAQALEAYMSDQIRKVPTMFTDLEAMKKDAERYRWLRAPDCQCKEVLNFSDDELDAAIDAAMIEKK